MDRRLTLFVALLLPVLGWSAVRPHDLLTWFLEVAPVLIGVPLMVAVRRRFPLSTLLLVLLWLHCVVLIVGGHYTYARVPMGEWWMQWFGWTRNNYDKLGHLAQGFVPAILTREILLRTSPLGGARCERGRQGSKGRELEAPATSGNGGAVVRPTRSRWLPFLVVSVCLAFSAFYELIEWWTAAISGAAAEDFLGTQGYAWDTQSDMALALVGAIAALALLSGWHDRSMARIPHGSIQPDR
jgi:putative membrane protein